MSATVAVLMGGWSAEREVSLVSGKACADALEQEGFDVRRIDVSRDLPALVTALTPPPDAVFNALHGKGGEDGCIQGLLETMGLAYTHSGVAASAIAMDKALTKRLLAGVGVQSPAGILIDRDGLGAGDPMPPPYVIKPNDEGSSVGISVVRPGDNSRPPDCEDWAYGRRVLVERYVPGRELTVGVLSRPDQPARALTVTEIVPHQSFYDYRAKYTDGQAAHILPAEIPAAVAQEAQRVAILAHETLGCSGVSRSDFRYDDSQAGTAGLFFLELNTQPGMTPLSLIPEQAAHCGLSFGALTRWLVEAATCHG